MNDNDFKNLDKNLKKFKRKIISLNDLDLESYRKKKVYDNLFYIFLISKIYLKTGLKFIDKIKTNKTKI